LSLSNEDTLRLNVLLANPIEAIRIDENHMVVHGLTAETEAKVPLNPNCRNDRYLKFVRAFISGHVLGSPEGYPIFLRRWTRMGHARDSHLADLLKLGEPEAVVAVTSAAGLTGNLARRAWWVDPSSENARRMLHSEAVRTGKIGKVLVEHLVEHLAFETEPEAMIETVKLILQSGQVDERQRQLIWNKGKHKPTYLVGFLHAMPDAVPADQLARQDLDQYRPGLAQLAAKGNSVAELLLRTLDSPGQRFLATAKGVLEKPSNQDEVVSLLRAVTAYFAPARRTDDKEQDIDQVLTACADCIDNADDMLQAILEACPVLRPELTALLVLAGCGDAVVTPIFAKTDAVGTVMRRRLEPVTAPLLAQIAILCGRKGG